MEINTGKYFREAEEQKELFCNDQSKEGGWGGRWVDMDKMRSSFLQTCKPPESFVLQGGGGKGERWK